MKKGKYDGVNPLERLGKDEPFFIVRGQDLLSVEIVKAYSHLLQRESDKAAADGNYDLAESLSIDAVQVISVAHRFLDWQAANPDKVKLPD